MSDAPAYTSARPILLNFFYARNVHDLTRRSSQLAKALGVV